MIKPAGATGPLEIVDTPTQLVDLFPTILDLLDLEPGHALESKSVYALAPGERRAARFGFDPDKMMNGPNVIEVEIDGPVEPLALEADGARPGDRPGNLARPPRRADQRPTLTGGGLRSV